MPSRWDNTTTEAREGGWGGMGLSFLSLSPLSLHPVLRGKVDNWDHLSLHQLRPSSWLCVIEDCNVCACSASCSHRPAFALAMQCTCNGQSRELQPASCKPPTFWCLCQWGTSWGNRVGLSFPTLVVIVRSTCCHCIVCLHAQLRLF